MKKIIIIDDDVMSLNSLNRLITEWNFTTETYISVSDILPEIEPQSYYCAIVDYKLPNIDGIKVLNALRAENNDLIAILISGFEVDEKNIKEIESKYMYFLKKPIDIQKLKKIINTKLEKK